MSERPAAACRQFEDPDNDGVLRRVLSQTAALHWSNMHEVSIMAEAVRMAVDAAQAAGANRIIALRLRVGTLSGAVPEAMQFAWDVVRRDTLAATARLEIESVPAACWCASCQTEFECQDFYSECPRCHHVSGELRRGRELEIANVELE